MSKKKSARLTQPILRTHQDPVSGELVRLVLDDAQRACERTVAALDRERQALTNAGGYALATEAVGALAKLEAGEPVTSAVGALAVLAREYGLLDASGRFRFAEKVREKLRVMVPHSDMPEAA